MGIVIQNTILKFSKMKNQTQKCPLSSKKSKTYIRRPQIKKFYKTDPQKCQFWFKIQFQTFQKTKNQTQKRPPKVLKNKNMYKDASNQKVL